ncbi:bifunctional serine/threonine-protein kinase/formylglycine-generating enzyme family protein [Dasania sp. GY-MA-18]|uniref:non-specific serine/threonine protein kinase n=1 Tax=Dasania phycosphaerae TaxID=2950436 RepID=A0A9J6RJZ0_9GAMM|nr:MULTISPECIES: bifunctional serine/threonine-protein kinase/formylglycine-generating enzyme family protein [Dasania]MCR8922577.1 bifunctional serine/threonine-protein kinase/formylglycine-generating enzyme family protein [Dasania sp. GY-MA-18]MCZ0865006.1 bifunctional serine/threonine-protein kinase/formylglycine-generating enzyme family protein [Dasania phycosphaerae]MCZ0868733.1 bifunctional serine/threonine-protein kinase/formylglycine-generating enzyme family protein [Dasania phycosphaerae
MAIPGYRILRKIRQGGMSTVYLAVQKSVDREVAIKVMSPSLNNDPSFGSRFYREAKIVGKLSHPNIISIYDVGSYKHYNYIAMDYLPGAPLQDTLKSKGVSPQQAVTIVREMAAALHYAHQQGFIHRDIKPDNILFREDGSSVLCDFGIAKSTKTNMNMTNIGSVLGTPHYMSPEQAQGKNIDGRSDLYSLGIVFFEMLTGHPPFTSEDPIAVAVKHMTSPVPKLPGALKIFQPIINRMLAKKPAARYQNGKEIIDALDALQPKLNRTHYTQHTQHSTLQVLNLVQALFSALTTAASLSFQRLLLSRKQFSPSTVQLDQQELEQIDDFILKNKESAIRSRIITKPISKINRAWFYIPALLAATIMGGFIYLNDYQPETLHDYAQRLDNLQHSLQKPAITLPQLPANQPAPAIVSESIVRDKAPEQYITAKKYPLTIKTEPQQAKVRILNIKPAYRDGIELEQGKYHIEVSAEDYHSQEFWVSISKQGLTESVRLEPTRRLLPAGSIIKDSLSDGSPAPTMVVIPKGQLTIKGQPAYTLTVDKPLAMSSTEVTFSDYDKFTAATGQQPAKDYQWGRGRRPVVGVSWQDAQDYAHWLSEETGQHYRLPKQQEWEYAHRANSTSAYWWGEKAKRGAANCRRGCNSEWSKLFSSSTAPVASYPANPYGLYDTAGNVAEWLADCAERDKTSQRCLLALTAGGSHDSSLKYLQSHMRKKTDATVRSEAIGFRLVLEL